MGNNLKPDLVLLGDMSRYKLLDWLFPNRIPKTDYLGKAIWIYYGKEKIIFEDERFFCYSEKILPDTSILISGDVQKDDDYFSLDNEVYVFNGNINIEASDDYFSKSLFCLCLDFPYNTNFYKKIFEALFNETVVSCIVFVQDKRRFGDTDADRFNHFEGDIQRELKSNYNLENNDFIEIKDNNFSELFFKMKNNFTSKRFSLIKKYKKLREKLERKQKKIDNKIQALLLPSSSIDFNKVGAYEELVTYKSNDLETCYKEGIKKFVLPGFLSEIIESIKDLFFNYECIIFWNLDKDIDDKIVKIICLEFEKWKSGLPDLNKPATKNVYILELANEKSKYYGSSKIFIDNFKKKFIKEVVYKIIHDYINTNLTLINNLLNKI